MLTGATIRVPRLNDHDRLLEVEENVHLFIAFKVSHFQLLVALKENLTCVLTTALLCYAFVFNC